MTVLTWLSRQITFMSLSEYPGIKGDWGLFFGQSEIGFLFDGSIKSRL